MDYKWYHKPNWGFNYDDDDDDDNDDDDFKIRFLCVALNRVLELAL